MWGGPLHRNSGGDRVLRFSVLPGPTRRLRTRGPLFLPPEPWRRRGASVRGSMIPGPPRSHSLGAPSLVAGPSPRFTRVFERFPDGSRPWGTLIPRYFVRHDRSCSTFPLKAEAARDSALGRGNLTPSSNGQGPSRKPHSIPQAMVFTLKRSYADVCYPTNKKTKASTRVAPRRNLSDESKRHPPD